jgi:dimethylaniline monooxygenase (N-oxide forming)
LNEQRVAVIGAGPCGLTACKALSEYGVDYECLEASDRLGGTWNIDLGGGGYRSLQTNTSTTGMAFSDFPFEEGQAAYLNAGQMVRYFQRYADHFQLTSHIHYDSRVIQAFPLSDGSWEVELESGETRKYSSLIVATGQYTSPRRPHASIPGEFSGQHLHVYDYMDITSPIDLRAKRVLVVGLGSSSAELAAELCRSEQPSDSASQVILSARSGRWVLPKITNGKPLDARAPHPSARLPAVIRALPESVSQWLIRRTLGKIMRNQSAQIGGQQALGLPIPKIKPWEERPTLSVDFIPALQSGLIDVRPGIQRFDGDTVHFTDETQCDVDVILYATGYQLNFPYLDRDTLGGEATELELYQRISHPVHDQLFFIGCCRVMCSMWPVAEQQSRWIASLLSGKFQLPRERKRRVKAIPLVSSLPVMCNVYIEGLRKEAGGL